MDPFLGEIRMFAGMFAPQGWANCDGSLIPISQNDALFTLFGTTYGGDGVSTFGLPNLLGRVPIHRGQGRGLQNNYVVGALGGAEKVTLLAAHLPAHTHALAAATAAAKSTTVQAQVLGAAPTVSMLYAGLGNRAMGNDAISTAPGGGLPHENRMPSLAITFIVAMAGTFPSQG